MKLGLKSYLAGEPLRIFELLERILYPNPRKQKAFGGECFQWVVMHFLLSVESQEKEVSSEFDNYKID